MTWYSKLFWSTTFKKGELAPKLVAAGQLRERYKGTGSVLVCLSELTKGEYKNCCHINKTDVTKGYELTVTLFREEIKGKFLTTETGKCGNREGIKYTCILYNYL